MGCERLVRLSRILFVSLIAVCLLSFVYKTYIFPVNNSYLFKTEYNNSGIAYNEHRTNEPIIENKEWLSLNTDKWIYIDKHIYIFSAYWETRIKPNFVRIVGIGLNSGQSISHVICALKYNDRNIKTTKVESKIIDENHGQKHTAKFYLCHSDQLPSEVSLFVKSQEKVTWLKVKTIEPNETSNRKLALCIQPLYGKFPNNNLHLAEFISFYQLLNASHFMFYDYKADTSAISLLTELSKSGVSIELLKWDLPDPVLDAWNCAQMASIVDCMYRQSHSHEYVFVVDIDEFLVPNSNVSLQNVIEGVDSEAKWCSYMFRQSFFCLQKPDDPSSNNTDIKLFTLKKTLRQKKIWNYYWRTKSIVRTAFVEVPGIHYIWVAIQNSNQIMKVNPDVALLHHYRGGISEEECNVSVVDKSAVKYSLPILNSEPIQVWERWNQSKNHTN